MSDSSPTSTNNLNRSSSTRSSVPVSRASHTFEGPALLINLFCLTEVCQPDLGIKTHKFSINAIIQERALFDCASLEIEMGCELYMCM